MTFYRDKAERHLENILEVNAVKDPAKMELRNRRKADIVGWTLDELEKGPCPAG